MTNKQKQLQLKHLGYYLGKIDGLFGPQSKEATRRFQRAYGLVVDGSFGPKTIAKSREVWKDIQTKLNTKNNAKLAVDGYVGTKTITAVKNFQNAVKISVDGYVGPITLKTLDSALSWNDFANFRREEFKCGCRGRFCNGYPIEMDLKLVKVLQDIRNYYGKPINITSGVRCRGFNNSLVGSVTNSPHLTGKGVDFKVVGVNYLEVAKYLKTLHSKGIIRYTYTNNTNMYGANHINL